MDNDRELYFASALRVHEGNEMKYARFLLALTILSTGDMCLQKKRIPSAWSTRGTQIVCFRYNDPCTDRLEVS